MNQIKEFTEQLVKNIENSEIENIGRLTVSIGIAMFENDDVFSAKGFFF